MWLNICQGLILLGWVLRLITNVTWAARGRKEFEPTGVVGIFTVLIFAALGALILWRAGAVSTILGVP